MLRIAICDDNISDCQRLRIQIREKGKNCDMQVQEFSSGEELLEAMLHTQFDGVFLDIQMKGMNGEEVAKRIRKMDVGLVLVFYTGFVEPSPVSFEVQPYRYIMKNMSEERMGEYIEEALQRMKEQEDIPRILTQVGKKTIFIQAEHIIYIEKYKRSTRVRIAQRAYSFYGIEPDSSGIYPDIRLHEKLAATYELLKKYGFGWPHDSYIVNFLYLCACTAKTLQLAECKDVFQITRSKAKEFQEQKNYFICSKYVKRGE